MSSLMYKPTIEGMPPASSPNQPGRRAVSPAFAPQFRRSLMQFPLLAGIVTVAVALVLLAFALRMHPMYSAESLVYIEPLTNKVLSDASGPNFDSTRYESLMQQEMQTAQRMDIMQAALATLPQATWSEFGANSTIAAQNLQNQLKVTRVAMSYQVSISLKGSDPVKTAAIVNAITTAFLEAGRKDQLTDADQRSQLLAEERQRIEQELVQTRTEQTQLSAQLGVANPTGEGSNPFDTQLDNLRSQLTTARTSHDMAAAQLAVLSGTDASHSSGLTAAANDAIANDAGLSSMRATINQRRATLSSQMAGLTPGNPVYKQDQDELADLDKTLETMTQQMRDKAARTLQDKLRSELDRTGDVAGRLNAEVGRQTAHATSAAPRLQRASDLSAEVIRLQTRYAAVDNALHSLQLETTGPGMVHLALAAGVPSGPEPNRKRLIELAALPLGFLCGLTAAVFARKRDQHIYTSGDVDDILGFATIAILPAQDEVSDAVLQEYYLRLAAGVEGAYRSGGARTFMLTAVSADTELAALVAALDHKLGQLGLGVIVADAGQMLGSTEANRSDRGAAGSDRHFEGLAPSILERMKDDHDLVLLEAPALLYSAQAEYIARCVDVTVLVAESGVTTRQELFRSGALLQRLNVHGVGAILHALRLRHADEGFRRAVAELDRRAPYVRSTRRDADAVIPPALVPEPPDVVQPDVIEVSEVSASPEHATVAEFGPSVEIHPVATVTEPVASDPQDAAAHPPFLVAEHAGKTAGSHVASDSEPLAAEETRMNKSWLQRLLGRDTEEAYSILPDAVSDEDREEDSAEPAPRRDLRLVPAAAVHLEPMDLPLREPDAMTAEAAVPETVAEVSAASAMPVPAAFAAVEMPSSVATKSYVGVGVPEPQVEGAMAPSPRLVPFRPLSFAELTQLRDPEAATVVEAPVAAQQPVVEASQAEPIAVSRIEEVESEPGEFTAEPIARSPEPESVPSVSSYISEDVEVQPEIVTELKAAEIREPTEEPAVEPTPTIALVREPAGFDAEPEDAALEEWVPAPLNRWDPIPPLRADEPWRSRQYRAAGSRPEEPTWAQEDPMRIPPTDRWGAPEAGYRKEGADETPDIVLTRRWGLLSRFQQGESFPSDQQGEQQGETSPDPAHRSGDRRG